MDAVVILQWTVGNRYETAHAYNPCTQKARRLNQSDVGEMPERTRALSYLVEQTRDKNHEEI